MVFRSTWDLGFRDFGFMSRIVGLCLGAQGVRVQLDCRETGVLLQLIVGALR